MEKLWPRPHVWSTKKLTKIRKFEVVFKNDFFRFKINIFLKINIYFKMDYVGIIRISVANSTSLL